MPRSAHIALTASPNSAAVGTNPLPGSGDAPNPGRSTAMTSRSAASRPITGFQTTIEPPRPWIRTSGSPAPWRMWWSFTRRPIYAGAPGGPESRDGGRRVLPPSELETPEGRAERDRDPGEARLDGRLSGRRAVRARRLGRPRQDAEEGGDQRGHAADEGPRLRRGLPRGHGAGHRADPARERLHHRQRRARARLRRGH